MKKIFLLIIVVLTGMGIVYSQTIEVNKPDSNSSWKQGSNHDIIWTITGNPGANVKIRLFDETGQIKKLDIKDSTPNDGKYPWQIPGSVPTGKYVIRVKTLNNAYSDDSEVFQITKKSGITIQQAPDNIHVAFKKAIKVIKPSQGSYWDEEKSYYIEWENTYTKNKSIKIDLYNSSGTAFKKNIKTIIPKGPKLTLGKISKTKWTIPKGTFKLFSNGWRIKITRLDISNISGLSEKFYIRKSGSVKKYKIYAKTINKYKYKWWKADSQSFSGTETPKSDPGPGKTRTGFENYFHTSGFDWYWGFIYRSHVFFDLSSLKGLVVSAKLYFNKFTGKSCALRIYEITKSWTNIFNVQADFLPNLDGMTSIVQRWVNVGGSNHGLLFKGNNENFSHNDAKCVTYCDNVYLELEILE